ncbi:MAG TPA: EamA family transporter [Chthoniobacterales bacterium]|nr:EamA family transporter [Chthoniobacterales bacterium]
MPRAFRWWANPWFVLILETLFVTASEVLLKIGASETRQVQAWEWTGLLSLTSIWIWVAVVLVILSFLCWIYVLRHIPLSIAFPLSNVVHVLVPVSCWLFVGEQLSARRWCGVAIVVLGLAVVARPVAKIGEKL